MKKLKAQPYKLFNKVQHYDWGTRNNDAYIPKFLDINPEPDLPYAELWIGAHPKSPSEVEIENERIPLDSLVANYTKECLGTYVRNKFGDTFPFLLKVLSAANALSIQLHPNKNQAEKLHKSDPKNYPDNNHKPEIAIAIDSLLAIAGFRPVNEIVNNLFSLKEISFLTGEEFYNKIISTNDDVERQMLIKELYAKVMLNASDKEKLSSCIKNIHKRLSNKNSLLPEESLFVEQFNLFGVDVGLLSFFFFNLVKLEPGQAIFTDAGVPHAYIKGNIIECMANSDNVVRAGLTNKFKDVNTLLNIMRYDFSKFQIINSLQRQDDVTYKTSAEEFEVSLFTKGNGFKKLCHSDDKPSVYLIAEGSLIVKWKFEGSICFTKFSKGESFLIPAFLFEYELSTNEEVKFYHVSIP